jgi:hypothetical protein
VAEGLAGMAELRPLFSGGGEGGKAVAFHHPQALSNAQQDENLGCARDQVVVDRKTTGAVNPMALSALSCE